jgi:precorrin-2 dehydrogenase / sirohydrochlorin ferrochelatase
MYPGYDGRRSIRGPVVRTLPAFLNLRGRTGLVVGGGKVGLRKAQSLLDAGGMVRLVCREPSPEVVPTGINWLTGEYGPTYLEGISLAFAAATVEVNRAVVSDARTRGIWVNSATDPETGDFNLPATLRKGRIELAIGTGGASPAAASYLRDRLAGQIDDAMIAWIDLLAEMRAMVFERASPGERDIVMRKLADPGWLDEIDTQGTEATRRAMRAVVDAELGR